MLLSIFADSCHNFRDINELEGEVSTKLMEIAEHYRWHIDEVREEYQRIRTVEGVKNVIEAYRAAIEQVKKEMAGVKRDASAV